MGDKGMVGQGGEGGAPAESVKVDRDTTGTCGVACGTLVDGRYEVERELGRGGMGAVFLARDRQLLSRRVVLKVLLDRSFENEWVRSRFQREVEALTRLDHPGVVAVLDMGTLQDGKPYFVMQFVEGVTLRDVMAGRPMPKERAADLLWQIGHALNAAHDKGIVHRDLKPENIMVQALEDEVQQIKIIDFGVARVENSLVSVGPATEMCVGTVRYMAPEQLRAERSTPASDIYSLGIIAYEMLTGRHPFSASSSLELYELQRDTCIVPPRSLRPDLSPRVEAVLVEALLFEPARRPACARDFADALRRALEDEVGAKAGTGSDTGGEDSASRVERIPGETLPVLGEASGEASPGRAADRPVVTIVSDRGERADTDVVSALETGLTANGYRVFVDRTQTIGVGWARDIEAQIRASMAVVVIVSETTVTSEMVAFQVQLAHDLAQHGGGRPILVPVRVRYRGQPPEPIGSILAPYPALTWDGLEHSAVVLDRLLQVLTDPADHTRPAGRLPLEPVGGAVPLDSHFYIVRPADTQFQAAVSRRDSVVLVKGARQMGKTSLLARALQHAREAGDRVVFTDFQKLNASQLKSPEAFFMAIADAIADQLDLAACIQDTWREYRGPNVNFERYIRREVLRTIDTHLVWGMDEVDRLFTTSFGSEVFGLFRSWHNERSLDPTGPWQRLTLAIAYATEAHLFISDINQSPFNVGTRLYLDDFDRAQVEELNRRHGSPLQSPEDVDRFRHLVGGHPYLVRKGLHEMVTRRIDIATMEQEADRDEGPFGDHLRRMLVLLARDELLCDAVRQVLEEGRCSSPDVFYRLRSAGVMAGDSHESVQPRCRIYRTYLSRHLA